MKRETSAFVILCCLIFVWAARAGAQVTRADYDRAQGLRDKYQDLPVNVPEAGTWNRAGT